MVGHHFSYGVHTLQSSSVYLSSFFRGEDMVDPIIFTFGSSLGFKGEDGFLIYGNGVGRGGWRDDESSSPLDPGWTVITPSCE